MEEMEDKISIIIPVYNAGNFIVRCLESIRRQTYKNFEVLLVDDCGTDDSVEIIQKYLAENPGFPGRIIFNEKNLGLSESRNKGIEISTGSLILFADQDDELASENALWILAEKMKATNADFVLGGTRLVQYEKEKESKYHTLKNTKDVYEDAEILNGFFGGEWAVTAWNKLYRKEFLLKNNLRFLPKILHEDELWAFETAVASQKIAFVNQQTYTYFSLSNPTSMTGNIKLQNILDYSTMLLKMADISLEKNLFEKSPKALLFLQNFAQYTVLRKLIADKENWVKVYKDIQKKFSQIPGQKLFRKPAELAYIAYRTKFDEGYFLYKKFPAVFARLL